MPWPTGWLHRKGATTRNGEHDRDNTVHRDKRPSQTTIVIVYCCLVVPTCRQNALALLPDFDSLKTPRISRAQIPVLIAFWKFLIFLPRPQITMCISICHNQPGCDCIYVTGDVILCQLITRSSESRTEKFRPKLITSHCRQLNIVFNAVDYVSDDVNRDGVSTNAPECPNIRLDMEPARPESCPLCNSSEVLKYFEVKGIAYVADQATHDPQDTKAEGGAEAASGKAAGKSVEGTVGESADKTVGTSSGNGGLVAGVGRAMEVVDRAKIRPGVEREEEAV